MSSLKDGIRMLVGPMLRLFRMASEENLSQRLLHGIARTEIHSCPWPLSQNKSWLKNS